jgi:hypothetical protein
VDSTSPHPPHCPNTAPLRSTDRARSLLRHAHVHLGVTAVLVALVVGLAAAATTGEGAHPFVRGLLTGLGTLGGCWGLLGVGSAVCRARLDARDDRSVDSEWARVEPVWTGRQG